VVFLFGFLFGSKTNLAELSTLSSTNFGKISAQTFCFDRGSEAIFFLMAHDEVAFLS
jgi:hypothetical protein